ncbi:MAG: hypothetical protein LBK53_08140 [Heliobacteriaceae bacterium]|jgi:hypothetical protein|nr:hypothetical protein [Heliobacteriaceae bacterium]
MSRKGGPQSVPPDKPVVIPDKPSYTEQQPADTTSRKPVLTPKEQEALSNFGKPSKKREELSERMEDAIETRRRFYDNLSKEEKEAFAKERLSNLDKLGKLSEIEEKLSLEKQALQKQIDMARKEFLTPREQKRFSFNNESIKLTEKAMEKQQRFMRDIYPHLSEEEKKALHEKIELNRTVGNQSGVSPEVEATQKLINRWKKDLDKTD